MLPDVLLWGLSFKLKFSVKPENGRGKTWNLWEEQDSFFFATNCLSCSDLDRCGTLPSSAYCTSQIATMCLDTTILKRC